jgi:hypothetical protein
MKMPFLGVSMLLKKMNPKHNVCAYLRGKLNAVGQTKWMKKGCIFLGARLSDFLAPVLPIKKAETHIFCICF